MGHSFGERASIAKILPIGKDLSKNLPRPMLARRFFATRLNGNFANLSVEPARAAWAVCGHSPYRMEWLDRFQQINK
jgi:hypothetical protein